MQSFHPYVANGHLLNKKEKYIAVQGVAVATPFFVYILAKKNTFYGAKQFKLNNDTIQAAGTDNSGRHYRTARLQDNKPQECIIDVVKFMCEKFSTDNYTGILAKIL